MAVKCALDPCSEESHEEDDSVCKNDISQKVVVRVDAEVEDSEEDENEIAPEGEVLDQSQKQEEQEQEQGELQEARFKEA